MRTLFDSDEANILIRAIGTEADSLVKFVTSAEQDRRVRRIRAMTEYRSLLFDEGEFRQPVGSSIVGQVFVAPWGATMRLNDFAIVVKETEKTATFYPLQKYTVSGGINSGTELPIIPKNVGNLASSTEAFDLRKKEKDGALLFLEKHKTFGLWSGEPMQYWGD